ncbi:uncharacterized protein LOC127749944 [Frankliniella occidentalis]|uniref:Uncharacterized protein LOC127749944 n=1 Tax=Frankliniella occidentalis TaxID=133901 RepID=A0A9C6U1Z8_FRAOC|nr:uncharacterized protein LOC127749944 [Frankliniella occidentalis]
MSTGSTALAALFLCLAAEDALANAITVITSRVVRHPEVPCALTLIPPLFQRADNDSAVYPPRLFVFGTTDWLDEFLRRFPSVASIYLCTTTEENVEEPVDFLLAEMMPSASIVLRIGGDESPLRVPLRVRLINWVSFDSDDQADILMSELSVEDTCHKFFHVFVTARQRGTTHVFHIPMPCSLGVATDTIKRLVGVWTPGAGWPAPNVSLFPPLCASWRPPPNGAPLIADLSIYHPYRPTIRSFTGSEVSEVLRLLRHTYGLEFETRYNIALEEMGPLGAADACRLSLQAFPVRAQIRDVNFVIHAELSLFPWVLDDWICVVPAGAGKPRPVLYPLTAEYTPAVWAALLAAVLTVVACLYLMRHDESVQELFLQALSPLLGQPLDDRWAGPQVAVLGGWLLTCLVVVAGYKGELLRLIATQNGEINSWQDWLESDLDLLLKHRDQASEYIAKGLYGLTESRVLPSFFINEINTMPFAWTVCIERVAVGKDVSFIISKYIFDVLIRDKSVEEFLSQIHTFSVPIAPELKTSFVATKGSPFEAPLRKLLGLIQAAGGLNHHRNYKKNLPRDSKHKPFALTNVMPVFAAYIAGNVFAVSTLLLELLLPTLRPFWSYFFPRKPEKQTRSPAKRGCQLHYAGNSIRHGGAQSRVEPCVERAARASPSETNRTALLFSTVMASAFTKALSS